MSKRETKKQHIIEAGLEVIQERGYHGTSVKDIVDAAGVPKGSFYNYFESKERFAVDMLDYVDKQARPKMQETLSSHSATSARQRLYNFFKHGADELAQNDYKCGCVVGNLCQEMADQSDLIREKANQIFRGHVALLAACLDESKRAGEIKSNMDSTTLAEFLYNSWEGALMRMKATHCDHSIKIFLSSLDLIAE